jgi:Family of unknown function (DUF6178)
VLSFFIYAAPSAPKGVRLSKKLTVSQMRSLRNIVDNPALPAVLGHMQPKTLARLIDRIGLNDAAEIMALVPARNLLRAMDEAVWKSPRAGVSQEFDPAEFVRWLQVWLEVDVLFVAERLAAINDEYLAMCLSSVLLVDGSSSSGFAGNMAEYTMDGHAPDEPGYTDCPKADCYAIYGRFLVRPPFEDDWEIIRAALDALWRHAPDHLLHVLGSMASSESMLDSAGRRTSLNFDVAFERERHLERRGYVSQTGARAFLASISIATTQELLMMSVYDNETHRFLAGIENHDTDQHPVENVTAIDGAGDELLQTPNEARGPASTPASQDQIRSLSRLLENEAIAEPKRFKSLPSNRHEQTRAVLAELLHRLEAENQEAFQQRTRELAYLATVLMAGSSLEGRPFTGGDARDAAFATCNLGVEFIHSRQAVLKLDREPGLIRLFSIGWQLLDTLRNRVIDGMKVSLVNLETTQRLKNSPWLRNEAQIGIRDLQNAVEWHQFADARDAATFLSIVFDATACREIAPLLDHLPHFAPITAKSKNKSQPRWIESIADLDRVSSLLSNLSKE